MDEKEKSLNGSNKVLSWQALGLMTFTSVWGFGNIVNGYANQGLKAVVSWILMFALYFIPYVLMVGEMGSTFKESAGGVSSWIRSTSGAKLAYFAGWTYWIVHMPYLAQKPQNMLIAFGWAVFQNGSLTKTISPLVLQSIALVIFFFLPVVRLQRGQRPETDRGPGRELHVRHEHPLHPAGPGGSSPDHRQDLHLQPELGYPDAHLRF